MVIAIQFAIRTDIPIYVCLFGQSTNKYGIFWLPCNRCVFSTVVSFGSTNFNLHCLWNIIFLIKSIRMLVVFHYIVLQRWIFHHIPLAHALDHFLLASEIVVDEKNLSLKYHKNLKSLFFAPPLTSPRFLWLYALPSVHFWLSFLLFTSCNHPFIVHTRVIIIIIDTSRW